MIFKKIIKGEVLEFDIFSLKKRDKISLYHLVTKRINHLIYKKIQRIILNPKLRNVLKKLEIIFFKKNYKNIQLYNDYLIKKKNELKKNNFIFFDNLLKKENISTLRNNFENETNLVDVYTNNKNFSYKQKPKSARMGYIPTEKIFENECILEAANNEKLVALLNNYFGCKYSLDWIWAWWSFKSEKEDHGPQNFHRDYESLNFVKVFVYLTDVIDKKDGCHEFVLGSSHKNEFYKRQRFRKNDINKKFSNSIKKIFGNSGTTFIIDSFGIHRGVKPTSKDRLVLSLLYTVFPSNRSPKIPPLYFSNLKNKDLYSKNKYLNRLFINFDK